MLQHMRRAQYEADLARRRFIQVAPENRLVAEWLEAEWNQTLRALADARETFEKQRARDRTTLGDAQRARLAALALRTPGRHRR